MKTAVNYEPATGTARRAVAARRHDQPASMIGFYLLLSGKETGFQPGTRRQEAHTLQACQQQHPCFLPTLPVTQALLCMTSHTAQPIQTARFAFVSGDTNLIDGFLDGLGFNQAHFSLGHVVAI
eukprot:6200543-Pleurochrysis_carterae.AAC.1